MFNSISLCYLNRMPSTRCRPSQRHSIGLIPRLFLLCLALLVAPLSEPAQVWAQDSTAAPAAGGILKVYSNVKGARVLLNDEEVGQTPVIRLLAPGKYKVRLELAGYDAYQEEIEIQSNKAVTINAQLAKVVGSLEVIANVEGARVFLNDKEVGKTPNVVLEDLPSGTYNIQVRKTGYTTYTAPITVKPNVRLKMHIPMIANAATVTLSSNPAEARVLMDNEPVGTTPLTLETVPAGRHALRIEKDGFATSFRVFQVEVGQKLELTANLSKEPGGLRVKTKIPGADVYLEGSLLGKSPLLLEKTIQPGQYSLRITQEGFADHIQPVIIEPSRTTKVSADLVNLEAATQSGTTGGSRQNMTEEPLTRQWWFWTIVGGVVLATAGGTTAAVMAADAPSGSAGDVVVTLP